MLSRPSSEHYHGLRQDRGQHRQAAGAVEPLIKTSFTGFLCNRLAPLSGTRSACTPISLWSATISLSTRPPFLWLVLPMMYRISR